MNAPQTVIEIDQILSPWYRETLSSNAQKLYAAVWERMHFKGQTTIWLNDAYASRRSRMLIQHIPNARRELVDRGLLRCWEGCLEWSYEYVEQEDTQD